MKRSRAIQLPNEKPSASTGSAEVQPVPSLEQAHKTRAQRFADAHAWVLEHHTETFETLAK